MNKERVRKRKEMRRKRSRKCEDSVEGDEVRRRSEG